MSQPLKASRPVANDPNPAPVLTAAASAPKTITLTYRPVKKSSRAADFLFVLALCVMTGATAWYASEALSLYVATKAMIVDQSLPLPAPRPVVVHQPAPAPVETAAAPVAQVQDVTPPVTPLAQDITPPELVQPQPPIAETTPVPASQPIQLLQPEPPAAQTPLPPAPAPVVPVSQSQETVKLISSSGNEPANPGIALPEAKAVAVPAETPAAPAPGESDAAQISVSGAQTNSDQMLDDARVLFDSGDSKGALAAYDRVLATDKTNQTALAGQAYILAKTGQFEASVAASHRLLKLYPQDTAARLNLVITLGRWPSPKAVAELRDVIAANPENATAHMALGKQYERQGDFHNAIVELDTAAHQAPNDLSYRLDLAILYDHAGYAPQAVELYKQVLQSGTSLPISSQTLEQRVEYLESLNNSQSKVNAPESSAR